MPSGKGTYGKKVGRPPKKKKGTFHPYNRGTAKVGGTKKKAKK